MVRPGHGANHKLLAHWSLCRLIALDDKGVTFKYKDYRIEGPPRYKTMTLPAHEFIRRFLIHVLPCGSARPCGPRSLSE
jgi:hypothetical protein